MNRGENLVACNKKRVDWNAIRAEYIGGGISQRKLAEKYGLSKTTVMKKANEEKWGKLRQQAEAESTARAQQKTAEAAATNAAKLEKAKGLLLEKIIKAIERMPENCGSKTRQTARQGDKQVTIEYDISELISAIERLERNPDIFRDGTENDGFLEALSATAAEDWADEES